MKILEKTDIGLVREENQDTCSVREIGTYFSAVVCDGMGGTKGGRLASSLASDVYQGELVKQIHSGMKSNAIKKIMQQSIALANDAVHQRSTQEEELQHMGTTLVSALVNESTALIANVGDSRAYHVSEEGIRQISRDHSVVENMVERGDLTPEEAKHHPRRNLITRALGPDAAVEADIYQINWARGDMILLCSDGLVNTVSDQEILFELIHHGEPDTCLDRLLALSLERGAPDNVTMLLIVNL